LTLQTKIAGSGGYDVRAPGPPLVARQPGSTATPQPPPCQTDTATAGRAVEPGQVSLLSDELEFYQAHAWCLNPFLTVRDTIDRLRQETERFNCGPCDWRTHEAATNVYLLGGALLNSVDEYLRGPTLRLPRRLSANRLGRRARGVAEKVRGALKRKALTDVSAWKERWLPAFSDFLSVAIVSRSSNLVPLAESGRRLAALSEWPLPAELQAEQIGVPSPFRRMDLTQFDIIALGERFVARFPDRSQAILLVGLRTSGSYFAPLLYAFLRMEGFSTVSMLTLQPDKGAGRWERRELEGCAKQGYLALIVDDPPLTGGTVFLAFDIARRAGFAPGRLKALVAVHSSNRDWHRPLPDDFIISLEEEQWYKRQQLAPKTAQHRLAEYFQSENLLGIDVVDRGDVEEFNAGWQRITKNSRGTRLKRIFEVRLRRVAGEDETRFVLAKSVGWGWLSYHAFLAGQRLAGLVPPMLGLRDGILYMEWIPQSSTDQVHPQARDKQIDFAATYVAARALLLGLEDDPLHGKGQQRHQNGFRLLERALGRAYGGFPIGALAQPRLARKLREQHCPVPTLIDGKMDKSEWIVGPRGPLKTDYEHHGLGKAGLNVVDPVYDLADTILKAALSQEEETELIRRYLQESGDAGIEQRLMMNKLLAGLWEMGQAVDDFWTKSSVADEQLDNHRRYMSAWNFLTVHTARYCGARCRPPAELRWRAPVVTLDIDGVLDRRLFGFPVTTRAGMEALSLLHGHDFAVVVNTARSVSEVRDYCQAYSLVGGVAEYGSYIWDAVRQRGSVLISPEALCQLDELKQHLRRLPGVFLDDRHEYSIRAFTYRDKASGLLPSLLRSVRSFEIGDGSVAPLPTLVVQHLMSSLKLNLLCFHHTTIDTTITAREINKGTGLMALRDWTLAPAAETIAIGDSEQDLSMFRVATRCFAPADINCAGKARLLGCHIVSRPAQLGLLDIVRSLAHPDRARCDRCAQSEPVKSGDDDLIMEALSAADARWPKHLVRALSDSATFGILLR
jgi:hydroxymethylpyrimidine pyrophosphatase-like HAD family hydrolase